MGREVRRMRKLRWIVFVGALATVAPAVPAKAASPQASCPGQELSAIAPVFRAGTGGFISFEARNPELEGWRSFGQEISTFSLADRGNCPEE
jgi:hypothetical protein